MAIRTSRRRQASLGQGTAFWQAPRLRADTMLPSVVADNGRLQYALPQLGPNLISNGTFDTNTAGWAAFNATLASVGGQLEITTAGAASFPQATQDFPTTPGSLYAVTVTARRGTTPSNCVIVVQRTNSVPTSNGILVATTTTPTTITTYFTAQEAAQRLVLFIDNATATGNAYFDDVSVREVIAGIPQGLGSNLVTNGDFSVGTGWTLGASWSISGGVANKSAADTVLEQQVTTVAGRVYEVTATSSFSVFCGAWDNAGQNNVLSASSASRTGSFRFYFVANDTTSWIAFSGTGTGTLDNVTVREVLSEVCPRGSDLITNGSFGTNTTGWAASNSTIAAVSGQLEVTGAGGSFPQAQFALTGLTVGAVYQLVASARRGTSVSNATVRMLNQPATIVAISTASTTLVTGSQLFVATAATDTVVAFVDSPTGSGTIYADDVSVRQVFPLLTTAPVQPALRPATFDEVFDVQAASSGAARPRVNEQGALATDVGVNQPRWDYTNGVRQLLVEDTITGGIRNQIAAGAVVGVLGSGGALPTDWAFNGGAGLTREIMGTGTINGIPYIDIRIAGTTADTALTIDFEAATQTVAAQNQQWTGSVYAALQAGTLTNISNTRIVVVERDASGLFLAESGFVTTFTSAMQRFSTTRTMASASTGRVTSRISLSYSSSVSIGLTLRIALPDLKQRPFLDSPTLSSGTVLSRAAEFIRARPIVEAILARSGSSMVIQGRLRNNQTFRRIVGGSAANFAGVQSDATTGAVGAGSSGGIPTPYGAVLLGSGNLLTGFGIAYAQDANTRLIAANGSAAVSIPTPAIPWSDVYIGGGPAPIADGWYDAFLVYADRFTPATAQAQGAQYV